MRVNILKKNSTTFERRVYEVLKELKVPFKHRWLVGGLELDFVIGKYVLDIDGHKQNPERNHKIMDLGLTPLHLSNEATNDPTYLKQIITKLWPLQ